MARFAIASLLAVSVAAALEWKETAVYGSRPPISGDTVVFHPESRRIIAFGGRVAGQDDLLNRLYMADWEEGRRASLAWQRIDADGRAPESRIHHRAGYDSNSDRMVIFGGMADKGGLRLLNDVWVLEHASGLSGTPSWRELKPEGEPPEPRALATALFVEEIDSLVVFGGCTRGPHGCDIAQNDLWTLEGVGRDRGARWIREDVPAGPEPRSSHSAVYDSASDRMVVFGGNGAGPETWNDVWSLSGLRKGGSLAWNRIAATNHGPPGRYGHSAVFLPAKNLMIIFGGVRVASLASNLWVLRHATGVRGVAEWVRLQPQGPPAARDQAAAVLDPARERLLITGGSDWVRRFADAWTLDLRPLLAEEE